MPNPPQSPVRYPFSSLDNQPEAMHTIKRPPKERGSSDEFNDNEMGRILEVASALQGSVPETTSFEGRIVLAYNLLRRHHALQDESFDQVIEASQVLCSFNSSPSN